MFIFNQCIFQFQFLHYKHWKTSLEAFETVRVQILKILIWLALVYIWNMLTLLQFLPYLYYHFNYEYKLRSVTVVILQFINLDKFNNSLLAKNLSVMIYEIVKILEYED